MTPTRAHRRPADAGRAPSTSHPEWRSALFTRESRSEAAYTEAVRRNEPPFESASSEEGTPVELTFTTSAGAARADRNVRSNSETSTLQGHGRLR